MSHLLAPLFFLFLANEMRFSWSDSQQVVSCVLQFLSFRVGAPAAANFASPVIMSRSPADTFLAFFSQQKKKTLFRFSFTVSFSCASGSTSVAHELTQVRDIYPDNVVDDVCESRTRGCSRRDCSLRQRLRSSVRD